jgi:hypothetical protein
MQRSTKILAALPIAVFFLVVAGGASRAADMTYKQAGFVGERADRNQKNQNGSLSAGKNVSLNYHAVEANTFPLLEKIIRDVNAKMQKKIESDFGRQLEEKLSRQIVK